MILPFLLVFFLTAPNPAFAQVTNDQAANAQYLTVDSIPYKSNTKNCTLEEACIDRKLTAKCLVYHNDQWFSFTTGNEPIYYLSIRNQDCRDVNGVQLQVIEGHLCKPSTYKILECVSLATQDDIYLALSTLKKKSYLYSKCGRLSE